MREKTIVEPVKGPEARTLFGRGVLDIGNEVDTVSLLLQSGVGHLRARDVLLRVEEVFEQSTLVPGDALALVCGRVAVSFGVAGLAAPDSVEVRTLLMALVAFDVVALSAAGLEELGSLLEIAWRVNVSFVSGFDVFPCRHSSDKNLGGDESRSCRKCSNEPRRAQLPSRQPIESLRQLSGLF